MPLWAWLAAHTSTLTLEDHDNLMRGDCTLAQNFPPPRAEREIDDRGGLRSARGAAIDDEGNPIAQLIAHAGGMGAF